MQAVTGALIDTYRGGPLHEPGRVFADLAVAITDGADAISGIAVREDRQELFGSVASMPTTWRVLDRIDAGHLGAVRLARAAREAAMAAGAGPDIAVDMALAQLPAQAQPGRPQALSLEVGSPSRCRSQPGAVRRPKI